MLSIAELLVGLSALLWLAVVLVPWQPWRNDQVLPLRPAPGENGSEDRRDTTVVIPARDEAPIIGHSLGALAGQGDGLLVVLVDDNSTDGTAAVARAVPGIDLCVVQGDPLPEGWAGKVWALEQGTRRVDSPLALLLDADVALDPGVVAALEAQARQGPYDLVSVMASLHMAGFWEKLLNPAFIYFFKMLYPFRLANSANSRFFSAAGGCMLLRTQALRAIGGLGTIRGALIDDCALAREIKRAGFRTWIGQSRAVRSIRPYEGLRDIWNMVARSAFTQLGYSPWVLLLVSFALVTLFFAPLAGLLWPQAAAWVRLAGAGALGLMMGSFMPTLRFYGLGLWWAGLMPLAGALYLGMTWSSALRYWHGERSRWKGRVY